MSAPFYVYIIIGVIGALVLGIFDRYKIIKSKTLRYFVVTFSTFMIGFLLYDLIVSQ